MILISPFTKEAKNYPYWKELVKELKDVVQIGVEGEEQLVEDFRKGLTMKEIEKLVKECDFWISVDSFLPHLAHHLNKPGVVIWGTSDPEIFGYKENLNILKDRKYLRANQFGTWDNEKLNKEAFLEPQLLIKQLCQLRKSQN